MIMILIIANVSVFMLQLLFSTVSSQLSSQSTNILTDVQSGFSSAQPWYYPAFDKFTNYSGFTRLMPSVIFGYGSFSLTCSCTAQQMHGT